MHQHMQTYFSTSVGTMHQLDLRLIFYEILKIRKVSLSGCQFARSGFCQTVSGTNLPNRVHYCWS